VLFEDVAHSLIGDVVSNISQRTLDPIVAPGWILLGKSQDQVDDDLADSWSADALSLIAVVPFLGNKLPVPAKNRVRSDNCGQFHQGLAPECFPFNSQDQSLVIG
jgi:hypothetical protein